MTGDPQVQQLNSLFTRADRRLRERLQGLTNAEYLWEPVPDAWTVRRRTETTTAEAGGRGDWVFDYDWEVAEPRPFTTIAWRLMHLVDVLGSYHGFLWGEGTAEDQWLDVSPDAATGIALWEEYASAFARAMEEDTGEALQRSVRIPWWPEAAPRWVVVTNVINETIHHGAEIGVLRDLYARQHDDQR